jgi:uncharacterized membrane protein YciS (DUF1049 family)
MKSLRLFNQPITKGEFKQSGIVFLEYVIIAFIVSVGIICALWWLYWHLQQMIWEIKVKLDYLSQECPMRTHPLTHVEVTPSDQPEPTPPILYEEHPGTYYRHDRLVPIIPVVPTVPHVPNGHG